MAQTNAQNVSWDDIFAATMGAVYGWQCDCSDTKTRQVSLPARDRPASPGEWCTSYDSDSTACGSDSETDTQSESKTVSTVHKQAAGAGRRLQRFLLRWRR